MRSIFFCTILCGFVFISTAYAGQAEQAAVTYSSGTVQVQLEGSREYVSAQEGMVLEAGDTVKTQDGSSAELSFNDDNSNLVRLDANTTIQMIFSGDEKLEMTTGEVFSSVSSLPSGSAFEIRTPTAVSGARGTDWITKVTEGGTDVEAVESTPYVRHFEAEGTVSAQITPISMGHMTTVRKFQKPMPQRPISDARRQQWQMVKEDVRKRAGEASFRRMQKPPFDRKEFLRQMKEKGVPSSQGEQSGKGVPPAGFGKDNAQGTQVLVSREGERPLSPQEQFSPGQLGKGPGSEPLPKGEAQRQGLMKDSGSSSVHLETNSSQGQEAGARDLIQGQAKSLPGDKKSAGGQPQEAGVNTQNKPVAKKEGLAPGASKGRGPRK